MNQRSSLSPVGDSYDTKASQNAPDRLAQSIKNRYLSSFVTSPERQDKNPTLGTSISSLVQTNKLMLADLEQEKHQIKETAEEQDRINMTLDNMEVSLNQTLKSSNKNNSQMKTLLFQGK